MTPTRRGTATIRDVARASGVSIATVTRTFQASPKVRPQTRDHVLAVAEGLGYRPDAVARALVTGSTMTVGLLVPSIRSQYWGEVIESIEQVASASGYSVIVASSRGEPDHEREMLELLFGKRLDGVIVGAAAGDDESWPPPAGTLPTLVLLEWDETPRWDLLRKFSSRRVSADDIARMADQAVRGRWAAHLMYDDVAGGRVVAEHLYALGHRSVAFVAGPPVRTCLLRLLGMRTAYQAEGLDVRVVAATDDTSDAARTAVRQCLDRPSRPTAMACYSDALAIGAVKAAHDLGLDIPADLSIVGYDDIEFADYVDPPLTTFRNPKRELGELAFRMVLHPPAGTGDQAVRHKLAGTLTVRGSTGSPPVR